MARFTHCKKSGFSTLVLWKCDEAILAHTLTFFRTSLSVACVAGAISLALPNHGLAQSDTQGCPAFPKVEFWGDLTHQSVRRYVKQTHAGNWVDYLNQLQRQYETLANIQDRGTGAIIKRQGRKVRLAGKQLDKYIHLSSQRLSIVGCLAEHEDALGMEDFSTAAGTPDKDIATTPPPQKRSGSKGLERTDVTLPKKLLTKLRKAAVRQSLKDANKKSVNDLIVEILSREMRKPRR